MKILLVIAILGIAMAASYTILDPVSGRVKTDLSELLRANDALSKYTQDREAVRRIDEEDPDELRGQEYLDSNQKPIYKQIKKYPYAHGGR